MNDGAGYERAVGLGLLGVVACLAWPIWGVIVAAQREFTWSVAASALIPLAINVLWLALALRVPGARRVVMASRSPTRWATGYTEARTDTRDSASAMTLATVASSSSVITNGGESCSE